MLTKVLTKIEGLAGFGMNFVIITVGRQKNYRTTGRVNPKIRFQTVMRERSVQKEALLFPHTWDHCGKCNQNL